MKHTNVTLALMGSSGLFCSFFSDFNDCEPVSGSPVALKPCAFRMSLNSFLPTGLGAEKSNQSIVKRESIASFEVRFHWSLVL